MQLRRSALLLLIFIVSSSFLIKKMHFVDTAEESSKESIIIFLAEEGDSKTGHFAEKALEPIRELAANNNLLVSVLYASSGLPDEVKFTPAIVFQNHKGRSLYSGRYTDIKRIETFIRTAKVIPAQKVANVKRKLPVLSAGRLLVAAPIKITPAEGTLAANFNETDFQAEARKGILKGLKQFKYREEVSLDRSDRLFYMDFYPWINENKELVLSLKLFSQHHCKESVFDNFSSPIKGKSKKVCAIFEQAAQVMEKEILSQMASSEKGDAFQPVAAVVAEKSWEKLGLALPDQSESALMPTGKADFPQKTEWSYGGSVEKDFPALQFNFPAPIDNYVGEVGEIKGQLTFDNLAEPKKVSGAFTVQTASVTMGNPGLDQAVQGQYLKVKEYPEAILSLNKVKEITGSIGAGQRLEMELQADFKMKNEITPVIVRAIAESGFDKEGEPLIYMSGNFDLALIPAFDIEGPDGPSPANQTLQYYFNFKMN